MIGSVYRYNIGSAGSWTFANKLFGNRNCSNCIGASIALNNNSTEMMVGGSSNGVGAGVGYYFDKSSSITGWTLMQTLQNVAFGNGSKFGSGIAMCGDTAYLGSPQDHLNNTDEGYSSHIFLFAFVLLT